RPRDDARLESLDRHRPVAGGSPGRREEVPGPPPGAGRDPDQVRERGNQTGSDHRSLEVEKSRSREARGVEVRRVSYPTDTRPLDVADFSTSRLLDFPLPTLQLPEIARHRRLIQPDRIDLVVAALQVPS